jgi:hypothetical protein
MLHWTSPAFAIGDSPGLVNAGRHSPTCLCDPARYPQRTAEDLAGDILGGSSRNVISSGIL